MTQPLALDSAPHGEAGSWRRGEELIDALAYVDSLAPAERAAVDKLIAEELKTGTKRPSDYLAELPPPYNLNFEEHPLLKEEYARVRAGKAKQEMDTTRYRLDPPPLNRRNDISAWRAAVDNAHSQLEHQYNRLLNLELLLQYGAKAWQAHIAHLEVANKRLVSAAADARKAVEAVNRERKLAQTAAAASLGDVEERWLAVVAKNREIEAACEALEARASAIHDSLPQRPAPRDPFGIREAAEAPADDATGAPSVNGGQPGMTPPTSDEHGSMQSVTQAMQD